ncbi:MIF4G domain-containing protein [Aphelenchoides bicaudatus]|nr:MIF4G domain-containing protein [Aphelenchoides bicaudatus]
MSHSSVPLASLNQRQQAPPNVQNVPMATGMNGNFYNNPLNTPHGVQSYNGYPDPSRNHPTLNLPKNSVIQQNQNVGVPLFNVYYNNSGQNVQGYPPSLYYPQGYSDVPLQMVGGGNYAPIPQPMPMDGNPQFMNNQYQIPGSAPYPIPQQQPQNQPAQQQAPMQPRTKKTLNFINPTTKEFIFKDDKSEESVPEPAPKPEEPQQPPAPPINEQEDAQQRFRTAITDRVKGDELNKEATPKPADAKIQTAASTAPVQQPVQASSAPPPSISIAEDSVCAQPTIKAASLEPTIKIDPPAPQPAEANVAERTSPAPAIATDAKEQLQVQEEEDTEKLLDLESRFTDLYEKSKENIEKQEYSFEVLDMLREIVKCYKKSLPPVELDLLKKKGLDVHSELPQIQNRKYGGTSNAFNPGWNNSQQTIVGSRKGGMYAGRHSDNKMRNKKILGRPSYDRMRQPPPPPVLDLRKAENAWKPKRREETGVSEDDKKFEAARKEIRSILNKITPTSYDELVQQFFDIDVAQNERYQQIAIELIFDKAVEEPKFCSLYTKLCKEQVDRGQRKAGSFFHTLIQKVQATFEGNSAFDENIKEIETKLEGETDEKKKADLKERLDMLKEKEKRYILGNIKFISHLYTVDLIVDQVISFCLSKLHQMFDATKDDIYVQYGIELLELISKIYFSEDKRLQRQNDTNSNVQTFVQWLSTDGCKNTVTTKIRVMIMNFEDFVKAGYIKRNADKGPKTIKQLHEDIRKEGEKIKEERIAYEAKQQQREDHRFRQPYGGRGSQDRKNVNTQDKRTSAVMASSNTAQSAPSRTISLRDQMKNSIVNAPNLGGGKTGFFSKKNDAEPNKSAGPSNAESDGKSNQWNTVKRSGSGQNQSRKSSQERN